MNYFQEDSYFNIDKIKEGFIFSQKNYIESYGKIHFGSMQHKLLDFRNRAQMALECHDLSGAFEWIMRMEEGLDRYPGDILPGFKWRRCYGL